MRCLVLVQASMGVNVKNMCVPVTNCVVQEVLPKFQAAAKEVRVFRVYMLWPWA